MTTEAKEKTGIFPFPPITYVLPFLVGLGIHFAFPIRFLPLGWIQLAIGLPIIGIAAVLAFSAIMALWRGGTTSFPDKPTTAIVASGPFRFSRNPIYLAGAVIYVGAAISVNMLWSIIFLPVAFVLINLVVRQEEQYLERKFGQEYLNYKAKVRRWL